MEVDYWKQVYVVLQGKVPYGIFKQRITGV